jgi:hypothetical protein
MQGDSKPLDVQISDEHGCLEIVTVRWIRADFLARLIQDLDLQAYVSLHGTPECKSPQPTT